MPIFISKGINKLKKASSNGDPNENAKSKANQTSHQSIKQTTSSTTTRTEASPSAYSSMTGSGSYHDHVNNSRNARTGGSGSSRQWIIEPVMFQDTQNPRAPQPRCLAVSSDGTWV
jgi:hypothetical protein